VASPQGTAPGSASYTKVAIAFHWVIALCIVAQLALGWRLHDVPSGAARYATFQLHKSIGLSILLLSIGRLAWRLVHSSPAPAPLPRWQRLAADLVHWGFYGVMIGLPLTGWIMISASRLPVPTMFWGVIRWPSLPGFGPLAVDERASWDAYAGGVHQVLAWATVAMLVIHVAGVLKHQVIDRDDTFAHMVPGARSGGREVRLWGALLAVIAAAVLGLTVTPRASLPAGLAPHGSVVAHAPIALRSVSISPVDVAAVPLPPTPPGTATPNGPEVPLEWKVTRGKLDFATSWSGAPVKGGFSGWDAEIIFSPERLAQSHISVRINILSVTTQEAQQTEALPTSDWFDAEQFPTASFRSTSIKALGGNRYQAKGDLTLRGVKRPLVLPFEVAIADDQASAKGSFSLDRTAFGVGQGEWLATDQIPAKISVSFSLQARTKSTRR
jgi:cytochrome b561/polyisoprenoid-binding protein YceI